jgi:hypothetical protein
MRQKEIEESLNLILIQIAELQERIWDEIQALEEGGRLTPELERFAAEVMRDVSFWMDQCITASESPPILLRRMEVHKARLAKIEELIRHMS